MSEANKKYDVFISHASEDKDSLVRPLASLLEQANVRVWYDEFSLHLGDSLSASIDKGIQESRYGLLVLSRNFLAKKWPDYEYRSLLMRQISGEGVILPLWYGISKEEVEKHSLYLADIKGLPIHEDNLHQIIPLILRVIRPDIWRELRMGFMLRKAIQDGKTQTINMPQIEASTEKKSQLTKQQYIRCKAVYYGIGQHLKQPFHQFIDGFEMDLIPERELQTWEIMNACYLEMQACHGEATESDKRDFFKVLLAISSGIEPSEAYFSASMVKELFELWKKNFYPY